MTLLENLQNKPREKRTPIEQCIVDAANLEDMRDGDYELMEKAIVELKGLVDRFALLQEETDGWRKMAPIMKQQFDEVVRERDEYRTTLIRIDAIFREFRGAGDRRCQCPSSILKVYGCRCGKQERLDLARVKLFSILDDIFPRETVGDASMPSDVRK